MLLVNKVTSETASSPSFQGNTFQAQQHNPAKRRRSPRSQIQIIKKTWSAWSVFPVILPCWATCKLRQCITHTLFWLKQNMLSWLYLMGNAIVHCFFQITGKDFESSGNNLEKRMRGSNEISSFQTQLVNTPLFWRPSLASPLLVVLPQRGHPDH